MSVPCPAPADTATVGALPNTGFPLLAVLAVALLLSAAGVGVLLLARRTRGGTLMVAGLLLAGSLLTLPAGRAHADPVCGPPAPVVLQVVVEQTSVNAGLAPGIPPSLITGVVSNRSNVDTYITAVTVAIGSVSKASGAPGSCAPVDFQLSATRMPVGVVLHPGAEAAFGGATIGFVDRPVNQDACRGAVVHLKYVSS